MADDKSKRGGQDRRRIAGSEPYEVNFARKHGLSKQQALKIIERTGGDREKANAEAQKATKA